MDKFFGLKIEYVLIFVILGLLYFTLGKCNCDRFSVGGQNLKCNQIKDKCMDAANRNCGGFDFTNCDLSGTNLTNFNLQGAILKGTALSGFLQGTKLSGAQWDSKTKWSIPIKGQSKCNASTILPQSIQVGKDTRSLSCTDGVVEIHNKPTPLPINECKNGKKCKPDQKCCYRELFPDSCCKLNEKCGEYYGCND